MNRRILLIATAWTLCLGTVSAVWFQHNQLGDLRARRQPGGNATARIIRELPSFGDGAQTSSSSLSEDESREVLRLRAEVTRLTARKRELAGIPEISEQLHAQISGPGTN